VEILPFRGKDESAHEELIIAYTPDTLPVARVSEQNKLYIKQRVSLANGVTFISLDLANGVTIFF
jgi:hypothetical protein